MMRTSTIARLLAAGTLVSSVALGAPRIGVVVLSHPGITAEHADEIAYDVAGAIASQIEGEAIAGQSVRDLLPPEGPAADCAADAGCGQSLAATLKVDEVLLLTMKKSGKHLVVNCRRVPRDAKRAPADGVLQLATARVKRGAAVEELAQSLYPAGSVVAYAEPAPPTETATGAPAASLVAAAPPPPASGQPVYKRPWFWPTLGTAAGVVVLTVVLGLTLGLNHAPTGPSITLP